MIDKILKINFIIIAILGLSMFVLIGIAVNVDDYSKYDMFIKNFGFTAMFLGLMQLILIGLKNN